MITPDLSILNQLGTPMFNSNLFANRPAAGIVGRVFISTDTFKIYRDNGTGWDQLAGGGTGTVTGTGTATRVAFWDSATSISSNSALYWDNINDRLGLGTSTPGARLDVHTSSGIAAQFNGTSTNDTFIWIQNAGSNKWRFGNNYSSGTNYFSLYNGPTTTEVMTVAQSGNIATFATNAYAANSIQSFYNSNTLNVPASTTFPSAGFTYSAINSYQALNFSGNATIQIQNIVSSYTGINRIDLLNTGTITVTQGAGTAVRSIAATTYQNQFNGTASGTITHLSGLQILGNYRANGTGILTVSNGYGLLINNLDDYGSGFVFTNRYGIYQAGTSDDNYFGGKLINTIKFNRQTSSYTLALSDRSKMIEMNVATANTLTVPPSGTTNFEIGTEIEVVQYGAGATTITAGSGVTIRSLSGYLKITGQYVAVTLVKVGTDEWYCFGNLTA